MKIQYIYKVFSEKINYFSQHIYIIYFFQIIKMGQVIKRGGRKQAFNAAKIKKSIHGAAKKAGFSPAKQRALVKEVGDAVIDLYKKKRVVPTSVIRKSVLGRIDRRVKSVGRAWRVVEKKKRK